MKVISWITLLIFSFGIQSISLGQSYNEDTEKYIGLLKEKYGQNDNYQITFVMTIRYPEQAPIEQSGQYFSQGEKYHISMPDQKIICDGEKQWVWDVKNDYVQLYSATKDAVFSPKGIFELLHSDQYTYAMTYDGQRDGQLVKEVQFKPNDDFSDLAKARLILNGQNNTIKQLELFYKDASRIVLRLKKVAHDSNLKEELFSFSKEEHPSITVDDLRLD